MNIWIKKAKLIEPKKELVLPHRMTGFFKLEAGRRDGRRRLLADWFPNLITDVGLNIIGSESGYLAQCRVGSGNAAPSTADTTLAAQVATSSSLVSSTGAAQSTAPYYGSRTLVYRFNEGVAEGNLAEVGIGQSSGSNVLFSRSLILDGNGDPTTITVLEDEYLDVTYQLRIYPPLVDIEDTVNIGGTNHDYTLRAAQVTQAGSWRLGEQSSGTGIIGGLGTGSGFQPPRVYSGGIGAITSIPSGTNEATTSVNLSPYGNNDLYRDGTAQWGLSQGNLPGGVRSAACNFGQGGTASFGHVQVEFDPVIDKTSSRILTLQFRHQWARGSV